MPDRVAAVIEAAATADREIDFQDRDVIRAFSTHVDDVVPSSGANAYAPFVSYNGAVSNSLAGCHPALTRDLSIYNTIEILVYCRLSQLVSVAGCCGRHLRGT